jgi:hypothetical protein
MTSVAYFSLALVSLATAIPVAQPFPQDEQSEIISAVDEANPWTCQPGRTICVDMFNGCGAKTGGYAISLALATVHRFFFD